MLGAYISLLCTGILVVRRGLVHFPFGTPIPRPLLVRCRGCRLAAPSILLSDFLFPYPYILTDEAAIRTNHVQAEPSLPCDWSFQSLDDRSQSALQRNVSMYKLIHLALSSRSIVVNNFSLAQEVLGASYALLSFYKTMHIDRSFLEASTLNKHKQAHCERCYPTRIQFPYWSLNPRVHPQ